MTETIYRASRSRPEEVPASPVVIEDATPSDRGTASPVGENAECLLGSPGRNSRALRICPGDEWTLGWTRPVDRLEDPAFVLGTDARCYLSGRYNWTLHALEDGRHVAAGAVGRGVPSLQAGRDGLLFQPDSEGMLESIGQDDGEERFWISLFMANLFRRPFVATVGDTLVVQGVELEPNPESPRRAELSSVEVWPLAEPMDIGPTGQLRPGPVEPVLFDTTHLHAAAWPGGIVTAEPGRILPFTLDLEPTAVFRGEFEPIALSLDEEGWVYLLVDEAEEGPRALWVLDPEGGRTVRSVLPQPLAGATTPPAVDYGHRVILVGGGTLLTLSPDGSTLWTRPARPAGDRVVVAADDTILLSEGNELVAFDRDGQRRVLFRFEEELCTAPALTAGGKLLVASREALHCLVTAPQA